MIPRFLQNPCLQHRCQHHCHLIAHILSHVCNHFFLHHQCKDHFLKMNFLGLHVFDVVQISSLQVAMSCDSDDLAVRSADLSYLLIKICMILDFPIFYDFLDIPFDILNILPWNGWDRCLYHIFPQQSHNSLISISGSHKPPSQYNEDFTSIFNLINH